MLSRVTVIEKDGRRWVRDAITHIFTDEMGSGTQFTCLANNTGQIHCFTHPVRFEIEDWTPDEDDAA